MEDVQRRADRQSAVLLRTSPLCAERDLTSRCRRTRLGLRPFKRRSTILPPTAPSRTDGSPSPLPRRSSRTLCSRLPTRLHSTTRVIVGSTSFALSSLVGSISSTPTTLPTSIRGSRTSTLQRPTRRPGSRCDPFDRVRTPCWSSYLAVPTLSEYGTHSSAIEADDCSPRSPRWMSKLQRCCESSRVTCSWPSIWRCLLRSCARRGTASSPSCHRSASGSDRPECSESPSRTEPC